MLSVLCVNVRRDETGNIPAHKYCLNGEVLMGAATKVSDWSIRIHEDPYIHELETPLHRNDLPQPKHNY